jgi:hypothetical protein
MKLARTPFLPIVVALGVSLFVMAGCTNPFSPRIASNLGFSEKPPVPNQPEAVLRLFVWCWQNRALAEYREIFTDDFRFVFAQGDSAGNQFRDVPVDREEELNIARNLFVGGGEEPPANRIVLTIDPTLHALPDERPGKDPTYHREMVTNIDLEITTDNTSYRVTGQARFFVVRGDSALIPQELKDRGFGPDPNRWYIQEYDDETLNLGPLLATTGGRAALRSAAGALLGASSPRTVRSNVLRPMATGSTLDEISVTMGFIQQLYAR